LTVTATFAVPSAGFKNGSKLGGIAEFMKAQKEAMMMISRRAEISPNRFGDRISKHLTEIAQKFQQSSQDLAQEFPEKVKEKRSLNANSIFHSSIETLKKMKALKDAQ
ncbi:hypothetical protein, partial [Salmonella sp. s55044]|uniref:hypothetical protein n=1 Tax=Salmonella sp. s55044 TaxID=3159677 RepID=UPI003980654F